MDRWFLYVRKPDEPLCSDFVLDETHHWILFERRTWQKLRSRTLRYESHNYFKELNLSELRERAQTRWLNKLSKYPLKHHTLQISREKTEREVYWIRCCFWNKSQGQKSEDLLNKFNEFQKAMGSHGKVTMKQEKTPIKSRSRKITILSSLNKWWLFKIYKNIVPKNYMKEWAFYPVISDENSPRRGTGWWTIWYCMKKKN